MTCVILLLWLVNSFFIADGLCLDKAAQSQSRILMSSRHRPLRMNLNAELLESRFNSANTDAIPRKTPVGSAPQYAIAGDSTIETPYQRSVVGLHFAITLLNLISASTAIPAFSSIFDAATLVGTIIASIVLGDLGTGIFHWSVDNYGGIQTPIFGSVCVAFQGHHDTPWTITFRSFCNNVFKIAYGTIPALLLVALLVPAQAPLTKVFLTLFTNWWLISQEFHKWAHMRTPPSPIVKILQDSNVILSRREHGLHHSSPYEGHYCILTGVCNGFLDKANFFRFLEKVVFKLTGNVPNTWKADSRLKLP